MNTKSNTLLSQLQTMDKQEIKQLDRELSAILVKSMFAKLVGSLVVTAVLHYVVKRMEG